MDIKKKNIQHIKKLLTTVLNTNFVPYKDSTVMRRVEKRMKVLQFAKTEDYINHLEREEKELQILGKNIFINVTDFFRDPHVFQKIKHRILPSLLTENKPTVKIWVAGCATGEEAYSFAILIKEFCEENNYTHKIKIIATDIKEEAIHKARQGLYTVKEILGVNQQRLQRFFDREGSRYRIKKHIRNEVIFAIHDITSDPPFARVDLLSCRNLLIYIDKENQQKVLNNLVFALNIEGFLVLGKSETAIDLSYDLKNISSAYKIYKRIENTRTTRRFNFDISYQDSLIPVLAPSNENETGMKEYELAKSFQQIIHQKYASAVVVIDEQFYVKHITHTAKAYIDTPEDYTKIYSLSALAPQSITALVRAAISEIKNDKFINTYPPLPIMYRGEMKQISITVEPLLVEPDSPPLYTIIFEERHNNEKASVDVAKRINLALQHQLADTEENLRKTIEKLENSNQNLLASNEELQSTNEEYISVNEELQTINSEYQETIDKLSVSNQDVDHLLQSTDIGTIFLDDQLHIRKFTNSVKSLVNIDNIDIRRPLKNFTHNLKNTNIYKEVKAVLDSNQAVEKEVVSEEDKHYLMRVTPYDVGEENRKGIVLSFINIQQLKNAEKALAESELMYRSVFNYANDGIVIVDENEKKVTNVNQRQLEMLGYSKEEYLKIKFAGIFSKIQSNGETIETKIKAHLSIGEKKGGNTVEWTLKRKDNTVVEAEISAVNMPTPYDGYTLNIIRDITQRKKVQTEMLASQKRFEAVFDTSPMGVSIADMQFNLIRVNKTFARMTGHTSKQLSQMRFTDITHHEDIKSNKVALQNLLSGKKKIINFEKRYIKKNGKLFWGRLWVSLLDDGSGEQFLLVNILDITKEKQDAEAIKNSELRYRSLFEKNIDAVLIYDVRNNKIRSVNKSATQLFECSKKYLLEHTPMDFFPEFQENGESSIQFFSRQMQNYAQTSEIRHFMQLQTYKGKPIEVEITAYALSDSPDSDMVVQFRDITIEKAAEKAIKDSEERFRNLFENSAIGIGVFDVQKMIVVDCNQQFAALHGFTIAEFKKTQPQDVTADIQADGRDTITHLQEQIEAASKNGSHTVDNWLCKRKDGTIFHAEVTLNILNEATPNIIFVHMRDITEKLTAQQTIKDREERFSSLFENSADSISIVDTKTFKIVNCNKKAIEIYGAGREKFIGNSTLNFSAEIQTDGRPSTTHIQEHIDIIEKQGYCFVEDWISKRMDGTEFHSEISLTNFPTPNEQLYIVQVRDITEKRQVQQQIQQQKDYLKAIIDVSPSVITVRDTQANFVLANQAASAVYGVSVEELIGRNLREFDFGDAMKQALEIDKKIIETGKIFQVNDATVTIANGDQLNIQVTKVPLKNDDGEVLQVLTVANDITEIKAAEKLLKEQKNYLRAIIDLTPNYIFSKNTNGEYILANKALAAAYGTTPEDLEGKTDADFNPNKEEVLFFLQKDKETMKKGEIVYIPEETITTSTGEKKLLRTTKLPMLDKNGKCEQMLGIAVDITESKQTERDLRKSQVMFKAVFENSYSIITVVDAQGNLIEQNKPLRADGDIYDMVGQPIWESEWFFHDKKVVAQVEKDFKKVMKGEYVIGQCTYLRTADEIGYMSYSGKPVYLEEGGELLFILGEARDITDLMLAQKELGVKVDELNHKNEELKKYIDSNMQLENFAYITSHDLREPLRTISGFASLLEKKYVGKLDNTANEYLGYILTSTKNMNALIEDLLVFSQVHTGEHKVTKFNLNTLLDQITKSLTSSIEETNAKIELINIPEIITANQTKTKQLFQNLISNAIKFRKPDTAPQITISAKSKSKFWEFTVQDNGIGINEAYFGKIFMIFKRLHTKDEYDGTGIGLSLCKKIVEQHGGEIRLESTLGKGTTFHFTIKK